MSRDDDKSLGDEATLQGGKETPADERSLGDRSTFGGGDGSSLSGLGEFADLPDHDMEIVDLSSRYKIEKSLGKGGMGEVLLATDTRLDRKVAIKRIRGDAGSSKAAVARFLTEAKSIAALSHNNVVQVYDYGRDQEGPFLIMEYVAGGSLLDRCKQGPIELEEAVELACQLCDGLGRAHDAGIIHRDIKPANILLTDDGVPKLTDFGLAKAESRDHTMTMAGAVLGTLDFMPPEQRQDASLVDARSDLWSLAATLYQMVTGESPKVIRLKNVPAQLQNLLDKALEESKDSRYQTASELKEALQQSLHGGNVASVELEQGVCPSCGTRNESSRKFCRNTSCAASLQVKCLSCSATIPVWEGVCGECGSLQKDSLEQRREEMAAQKSEAETCLDSYDYKRATELAVEIGNEADPRLQQLKSWSEEFPEQVESIKRVQVESAKQAIAEALSHEKAYDYRAGIKALKKIPAALLTATDLPEAESARDILTQLQEKHDHADTLEAEIKSRIKARNLSGLLFQVESLLELLPERADLLKLQQQLQKRESGLDKARLKTVAAAKASIARYDYANALSVITLLDPEKIDSELAELRSLANVRESRSQELCTQIRQAVSSHQHDGLLALIEEYLTLKPDDAEILKSRDELLAREKKKQAEAAALLARQREEAERKRVAANELAAKQRARKLQLIVGSSIAAAFVLMLTVMFYLRAHGIARDISGALDRGDYATALELDPGNRQARMMQQTAEDLATALRSRDYQRALQLDPSNAEALSMKKAADIQQALSDGDYVAALQLDPSNAEALSMKKAAESQQALSGGDYAAVLQLDPSNAEALSMQKTAADVQRALSDGDYVAALELDPSNAEALSMKKAAEIQQALSGGDYAAVLQLDPSNAEALSMQKTAADVQRALSDGDYVAALQLDPSNAEALSMKKAAEIQQALSGGDYVAALKLDPSNAEALSMKKTADIQQALSVGNYAAALRLDRPAMLSLSPVRNSIGMDFKLLPSDTFMMGYGNGASDETPHEVTLTQPFQMGIHEVTQTQYEQVMGVNPSKFKRANNPVENVSWEDAVEFCRKLSALPSEKAAGRVYRLPTEAEWEYACRAGTTTMYSFVNRDSELGHYAWFDGNSGSRTHPVGGMQPNAWGLYDMHGNVWEWCQDWYGAYPRRAVTNPSGARTGSSRVNRGGSWSLTAESCRSAFRFGSDPAIRSYDLGFRVCLSPSGQ